MYMTFLKNIINNLRNTMFKKKYGLSMEKCSYLDPGSDYTLPAGSLKYSSDLSKRSQSCQIFTSNLDSAESEH